MRTRRAFVSMYVIAAIAVICLIALAVCLRNCRKILYPRVPRIVTLGPYEVASVETGASLTVKIRKRRTKQVILQYIATPAMGEQWHNDSVESMRKMAGSSVTVQVRRRGLFRSTGPEVEEAGSLGTDRGNKEWPEWFDNHLKSCEECRAKPGEGPPPLCPEAFAKVQEILSREMVEVDCFVCEGTGKIEYPADPSRSLLVRMDDCYRCGGDGKWLTSDPEEIAARGPLLGIVFGESGICLNKAMIEAGYARCNEGAPKEWKNAEAKAKELGFGIWSVEDKP